MPYIPQFNKLSLQEMSYAPSLLRQQQDELVTKQMELADALKFDYLKQDAPGIEPVLTKYNKDIDDISKQIAQQGFSHDIKNKVLGLRNKYVTDDKIRSYKKNYADAMAGWEERKKSLLQQRASGEDIQAMKKAYFSPEAYKGAYDEDNIYREFTPGATSNVYDISEDIKNKFANIGSSEVTYGGSGTKAIREVLYEGTPYERVAWKILDSTGGTKFNNLSQREAVKELIKSEYTDPSSDKALYAKLTNKSPEYIDGLIDQWSEAMNKEGIGNLAQTRGNYMFDQEQKSQPLPQTLPEYNIPELRPKEYNDAEEDIKVLSGETPKAKPRQIGTSMFQGTTTGQPVYAKKTMTNKEASDEIVSKYKTKYKGLFKSGVPETEAAKRAALYEMKYAAKNASVLALKSKDIVENLFNSLLSTGEEPVLRRINSDGDKGIKSFVDLVKTYEGTGLDWKQVPPLVNPYGKTFIRDAKGNKYEVNESAFDESTQDLKLNVIKPTMDRLLDPQLFDKGNADPIEIPGGRTSFPNGLYMDVDLIEHPNADPYNVEHRIINIVTPSGNYDKDGTPLYYKVKTITPGEAFQELTEGQRSGYQTYIR